MQIMTIWHLLCRVGKLLLLLGCELLLLHSRKLSVVLFNGELVLLLLSGELLCMLLSKLLLMLL